MSRPYFEETQYFRNHRFIWILLIGSGLVMMIPLLSGVYVQFVKGEPWGDKPMTDTGLIIFLLVMILVYAGVMALVLSMKLEVKVDHEGINVRFFPLKPNWRTIKKHEIAKFDFHRKRSLFKTGGLGYHRNFFSKTESMSIVWGPYLLIELKNKYRLILGTQNYEGLQHAMNKLFERTTLEI